MLRVELVETNVSTVERDECVEPCLFQRGGRRRSSSACTSVFFCALCVHVKIREKKTTR